MNWKLFYIIATVQDYYTIYDNIYFVKARNFKEACKLVRTRYGIESWVDLTGGQVPNL